MKTQYEKLDGIVVLNIAEDEHVESEIANLRAELPTNPFLVISPSRNWRDVRSAFESGAIDYLTKRPKPKTLAEICRRQLPLTW